MILHKIITTACLIGFTPLAVQAAPVLISENFDTDPVGGNPTVNNLLLEQGTTVVAVVDSSSNPADPFGGVGNRSFYLEDADATASAQLGWATDPFVDQGDAMTLNMKMYVVNGSTFDDTYQIIRLGSNNAITSTLSTAEAAVDFIVQEDRFQVNQGSGGVLTLDQTPGVDFALNSVWEIEMAIDPGTSTYSVTINGTQLTDDGGNVTEFGFRNDLDVNFLSIIGLSSNDGTRVFYDDIDLAIVPEPGSMSLLGLMALGLLKRTKRRD